jgi:hypothetical protein
VVSTGVERGGEKLGQVGAAVPRIDAVGEGDDVLGHAIVVLDGDLYRGRVSHAVEIYRLRVDDVLVVAQPGDVARDTALEVVGAFLAVTVITQVDEDALVG